MAKDPAPIPKNSQKKKGAGNLSVKSSNHQPVVWRAQKRRNIDRLFLLQRRDKLCQNPAPPPLSPSAHFENSWFYHGHREIYNKKVIILRRTANERFTRKIPGRGRTPAAPCRLRGRSGVQWPAAHQEGCPPALHHQYARRYELMKWKMVGEVLIPGVLYCTPKTFAVTQVVIGLPLATVAKVFFPIGTRSWKSWMPLPIRLSIFCL